METTEMIDLHTHSNVSDGTDSPEQLIELAAKQGISTIALCDHDTTSGLQRFLSHATHFSIKAVPGIEISAEWKKGNCHILGLNIDTNNQQFERVLNELRAGRDNRNVKICEKLKELGVPVYMEEIEEFAQGEVVARPHIAMVLVRKGYCSSINEAFDKFITKGAPAYVDRFRLEPSDAVAVLKKSGARVILAHPTQLNLPPDSLRKFASSLIEYGLDGLEVYTPYTPDEEIASFSKLCKELGLKASGGSDYHGDNKPDHSLGFYRPGIPIPDSVSEAIS